MSYNAADEPVCDSCLQPYPPHWPNGFTEPWPVVDEVMEPGGRMTATQRSNFHICGDCMRLAVLAVPLSRSSRSRARRSAARWQASERLLSELKLIERASIDVGAA